MDVAIRSAGRHADGAMGDLFGWSPPAKVMSRPDSAPADVAIRSNGRPAVLWMVKITSNGRCTCPF